MKNIRALPATVIVLAVIGLLINVSTTMIYSQLAMYMKHKLGASALQAATVDGIVESISHLTRIASGIISDMLHNRKGILAVGYVLALIAKPLYLFSSTILLIFLAQSLDRLGNGTIASPRDALIGDVTQKPMRGASYGFLKSLKTAGSMMGAFLAMVIMVMTADNFMMVFSIAIIPAVVAVIMLFLGVKEPRVHRGNLERRGFRINKENLRRLGKPFWGIIAISGFFELSHFSEALLSWRANEAGLPQSYVAAVMVIMNVGQFLVAYPLGMMSDKFSRKLFLLIGFIFMVLATFLMGHFSNIYIVMLGVFFWGAQMSTTQSIFLALISDEVDKDVRGTAFGIFYFVSGICYLIASQMAGFLWDRAGYKVTFSTSTGIALCSFFIVLIFMNKAKPSTK